MCQSHRPLKDSQCKPLNIILLSYDSISRVSWFKRLPRTTDYILNEMKFSMLYGQSILGDGTPACMIPLLTGRTEEELPSVLKSDPKGSFVDQVYPFIWNELHPRGYMSYQMEDWPQVTTFTYRMRGMSNRTVHHYMRPYQMTVWSRVCNRYGFFQLVKNYFLAALIFLLHYKFLGVFSTGIELFFGSATFLLHCEFLVYWN